MRLFLCALLLASPALAGGDHANPPQNACYTMVRLSPRMLKLSVMAPKLFAKAQIGMRLMTPNATMRVSRIARVQSSQPPQG